MKHIIALVLVLGLSSGAHALTNNPAQCGTYTNTYGNEVPRPCPTPDGQMPSSATAHCSDGSWSYSQSRSGTCSWHGGVETWCRDAQSWGDLTCGVKKV